MRADSSSVAESVPRTENKARLLACVDQSSTAPSVVGHAAQIAASLGLDLTLARVLEHAGHFGSPADPIDWQLQCQEHSAELAALSENQGGAKPSSQVLLTGDAADELIDWSTANGAALLALATRNDDQHRGIGSTALRVLEHGSASLLLIPPCSSKTPRYRRILVPIDGSPRAESVIPVASRIARHNDAELVLVHVIPTLAQGTGYPGHDLAVLQSQIERQHRRGARAHLDRLRVRAQGDGIAVRSVTLGPADPRHTVCGLAREEEIDLVVMSSHGATGLNDIPCGSVAEYLATHCSMPVLMVRPSLVTGFADDDPGSGDQTVFRFG